jgi:hypothetical protein
MGRRRVLVLGSIGKKGRRRVLVLGSIGKKGRIRVTAVGERGRNHNFHTLKYTLNTSILCLNIL